MATLEEMEARYGGSGLDLDEMELRYGVKPPPATGPLRQNPQFSVTPTSPGVPHLPPVDSLPKPSSPVESFGNAVVQGMTGGFADEAGAVLGAAAEKGYIPSTGASEYGGVDLPGGNAAPTNKAEAFGDKYRRMRDDARAADRKLADDNPKATAAGGLVGAFASPLAKLTGKSGAGQIAGGVAQGAVFGAGNSDADLTKGEVRPLLTDTIGGGIAGGVAAGASAGLRKLGGAVVNKARNAFAGVKGPEDLSRRVLNEVAEGTAKTTPTARKNLAKMGDQIVKEIVHGPEGDALRGAVRGSAREGSKYVNQVANSVTQQNNAAYGAFEGAGKGAVDANKYRAWLQAAADKVRPKGGSMVADAIEKFGDHVVEEGRKVGGLTLVQLRGLTTQAQNKVADALGSLNEKAAQRIGRGVQRAITPAMKRALDVAAEGNPTLQHAARTINANNQRIAALMTMGKGLDQRVYKEATQPPFLVKVAEGVGQSPTGALLKPAAVAVAKKIEGARTTAAIKAARGQPLPGANVADSLAKALGLAETGARIRGAEDEQ